MISPIRLSGRAVIPAKALFLNIEVNESAAANTTVTVAMARRGLSRAPGTLSGWDHSHFQAIKNTFFFFLFLHLRNVVGSS